MSEIDKHIDRVLKARDTLKKGQFGAHYRSHASNSFALVYDGRDTEYLYSQGCCGGFANPAKSRFIKEEKLIALVNLIVKTPHQFNKQRGSVVNFINWFLNESPYSSCFYTKDANEALNKGVICNVDVLSNLLIGGIVILRDVSSTSIWRAAIWDRLVKYGMKPHYAYILCLTLFPNNKLNISQGVYTYNKTSRSVRFSPNIGHAALVYDYFDKETIKNFCKGEPKVKKKKFNVSVSYQNKTGRALQRTWSGAHAKPNSYKIKWPKKDINISREHTWNGYINVDQYKITTIEGFKSLAKEINKQFDKIVGEKDEKEKSPGSLS